jgi:hypothetical protein
MTRHCKDISFLWIILSKLCTHFSSTISNPLTLGVTYEGKLQQGAQQPIAEQQQTTELPSLAVKDASSCQ